MTKFSVWLCNARYSYERIMTRFHKFLVWLHNAQYFHERIMMRFLRKRGWIVFYLDKQSRTCGEGICWMKLYQQTKPINSFKEGTGIWLWKK